MKNWTQAHLTQMLRGPIVHIDLLKNGESSMPEDKNRPHLYNPHLAQAPDPIVMPSPPYGGTYRVAADDELKNMPRGEAIGRIVLVDFEKGMGRATLRKHLPRPLGTVVATFGNVVDVQLGYDPYKELRDATAAFDSRLKSLMGERNDACTRAQAAQDSKYDLQRAFSVVEQKQRELGDELGECYDQLNNEKNKRAVDVQAREAAEKRVKALEKMLYPLRSYSFPGWASMRPYSSFPSIVGADLGSKPAVAIGTFIHDELIVDYAKLETSAMQKVLSNWYKGVYAQPAPKAPEPDMWTTGDGSRIEVTKMTDAHLHYAIAKIYRGEYPDAKCRTLGFNALKREAARRLQGFAAPRIGLNVDKLQIENAQLKREAEYERDRRLQMGQTNARLNVELDGLKSQVARVWKDPNQEAKVAGLQAECERHCEEKAALRAELMVAQNLTRELQNRLTAIRNAAH